MIIAVDFDGTCVKHRFPYIGEDIGAVPVLKALVARGHRLILWTIRSGGRTTEDVLAPAVQWFKDHEIPLFGINENPEMVWSKSNKAYANLYIDDAALGCPMIYEGDDRGYVDWTRVEALLKEMSIL